ncbi:MAG: PH domain-containing protein [Pyrinomonadaceae bacterium]|nr:PH domain-containing protein [Pyrinomonadaceae bacterium]
MFCIKCGAKNSDEALFCQKCGFQFEFEGEEETQIAKSPADQAASDEDEERSVFSIRPTLLFVKLGYGLAVIGAFLLVALIASLGLFISSPVSAWIVVLIGLSLLLIPAYYHLKQKMVRYTLTDSKIEIDEGLISKTTRNVPLRIIQDVTVSANFYQRLLGFGDVEIENANESDSLIVLRNINSPKEHAAEMLDQMRRLNK